MKYEHLFSPIKVNGIYLKNRIIAAPIGEEFAEDVYKRQSLS